GEAGQETREEDRGEVVEGPGSMRLAGGEALEVLVNEEELEKPGILRRHQNEPRQSGCEEHEGRGSQEQSGGRREAPGQGRPGNQNQTGEGESDESLAQEGSRGRETSAGGPQRPGTILLAPGDRFPGREKRRREKKSEQSVGQIRARKREPERRGEIEDPGREPKLEAPKRGDAGDEHRDGADPGKAGREPCRPRGLAEQS